MYHYSHFIDIIYIILQYSYRLIGFGNCVPKIVSTFQDSRVALLLYSDVFCCDLASAMHAGTANYGEIELFIRNRLVLSLSLLLPQLVAI